MPRQRKLLCKNGHPRTPDNVLKCGTCRICSYQHSKEWRERNPEKSREVQNRAARKWQAAHPEAMQAINKKAKLKKYYGLTVEQFDNMVAVQENKCAICKREMNPPHVDHDHNTGGIRDLLCNQCNPGLGAFREDIERMQKAIEYLQMWRKKQAMKVAA